jgi:MYXO-CTERM domain-containing protein
MTRLLTLLALAVALGAPSPTAAYTKRHIFVANRGGNNVLELDDKLQLVRSRFDSAGLSVPNGMAFTPKGEVYIADTGNNRIVGFDDKGSQVVAFSVTPFTAAAIESLNFDAKGVLFASANPGQGRVLRTDGQGNLIDYLVDDASYVNLGNVNFTKDGNIIADFSGQGRGIREVDSTGKLLRTFGQQTGLFYEDMVVDGADRVFASRLSENDVAVFDAQRKLERTITAPGLTKPTGIVLTWDCRLIVASFGSDELYEFRHDGSFVRKVTITGMSLPESLAIVGQRLTGSFGPDSGNTMEPTPRCDGTPTVDAGTSADSWIPRFDGGAADQGGSPADQGSGGKIAGEGGCGCGVVTRSRDPWGELASWPVAVLIVAALLFRRRRQQNQWG